jgi:heavy metal sensor kinase
MRKSIRFRLTAWHTAALAAVLLAFGTATAAFLGNLTRQRSDRLLEATVHAFHHAFEEEYSHHRNLEIAAGEAAREFRFSGHRVQVYDDARRLVADSDSVVERFSYLTRALDPATSAELHLPADGLPPGVALAPITNAPATSPLRRLIAAATDHPAFGTIPLEGDSVRASALAARVGDRPFTLVALQIEDPEQGVLRDYLKALLIAVPLALLLAAAVGYALSRKALMPVMAMGEHAARIGAASLYERLPVINPEDELGRLATIFNDLLSRLERAFGQQHQFMADASHELRTPLAILRAEADVALTRADRDAADYRASLETIRDDAATLSSLVEDLFTLARADAGDRALARTDLYLEELVSDAVRAAHPLAERRGVALHFTPDAEAPFAGDAMLLRRLLLNLLDNAIRHTPAGGRVEVTLTVEDVGYRVAVRDTGSGIPAEAQPFIFDRFFRADPARARTGEGGGAGLGLPIARWIAEAHGGSLELEASGERGTCFALQLPR